MRIKIYFYSFYKDPFPTRQDRGPEIGDKALQLVISGRTDLFHIKWGIPKFKLNRKHNIKNLEWADVILGVGDPTTLDERFQKKVLSIGGAPINKRHWGIGNKERNFYELYNNKLMGFICQSTYHRQYIIDKSNVESRFLPVIPYPLHPFLVSIMPEPLMNREYDVLLYVKFIDADMEDFVALITKALKRSSIKWHYVQYGFYNRKELIQMANNSKTCLNLSYYETQGIAQMEISAMGCYMITFEEGYSLITPSTGEFIPCLKTGDKDCLPRIFQAIMKPKNKNNVEIAEYNREIFNGHRTCQSLHQFVLDQLDNG